MTRHSITNRGSTKFVLDPVRWWAVVLVCLGTIPAVAQTRPAPAMTRPADGWWWLVDLIGTIWGTQLVHIGGQPIDVSQIVVAIVILVFGLMFSRWITRRVSGRLLRRQKLHSNAAIAVERILFYILALIVLLTALQTVNIPVTVFAFFGGAAAIGLGFGAQNIFNNFISGLILMFEGHIRLGDLVEVDNSIGHVAQIGGRCTRIKRVDGVDLLVPNSKMLETSAVNWTLSDDRVRASVRIGVAYGSPTETVRSLLLRAVGEQPTVLAEPKPSVIFDDFGDNALLFEVFFWGEVETMMDLRRLRSDIRFKIDALFRENKISISFPQCDVHLDAPRPLDVRVLPPEPPDAPDVQRPATGG